MSLSTRMDPQPRTYCRSVDLAVAHLSAVHDEGAESGDDVPIPSNINYTREMSRFGQHLQYANRLRTSCPSQAENVFSSEQDSGLGDIRLDETILYATTTGNQKQIRDPESLINEKLLGMVRIIDSK